MNGINILYDYIKASNHMFETLKLVDYQRMDNLKRHFSSVASQYAKLRGWQCLESAKARTII